LVALYTVTSDWGAFISYLVLTSCNGFIAAITAIVSPSLAQDFPPTRDFSEFVSRFGSIFRVSDRGSEIDPTNSQETEKYNELANDIQQGNYR
jgi:hypothetical protein